MRSAVLTAASLGMTAMVLGNAWFQRQQFYPSVVYITKSNPSMAVIYLQVSLVLLVTVCVF
jgi:E3 ubiquitin-protein ligase synoviolin